MTITAQKFNELLKPYFDKTLKIVQSVIDKAGKTVDDIHKVIFVGGSSKIHYIREAMKKKFPNVNFEENKAGFEDEAVSIGTAIQRALIHTESDSFGNQNIQKKTEQQPAKQQSSVFKKNNFSNDFASEPDDDMQGPVKKKVESPASPAPTTTTTTITTTPSTPTKNENPLPHPEKKQPTKYNMSTALSDVELKDITAHSLGIRTVNKSDNDVF